MKKLIIAIMIIITPAITMAEEEKSTCETYAGFGKQIMELRQQEFPLNKLMGTFADKNPGAKKLMKSIVVRAYRKPCYTTDSYKEKAIKRFYNKLYLECLQAK